MVCKRARARRKEAMVTTKKLKMAHDNHHREEEEEDRISQLPDAVLHHILSFIPLESAARTSVLSSRWKDLWTSMWAYATCFDFGQEFSYCKEISSLVRSIDRCLELHKGNSIEKFRLYIYPKTLYRPNIGKWIQFAARKGVKELDLHFAKHSWTPRSTFYFAFKLPFSLFTCSTLTVLKLSECGLHFPKRFKGFPLLKSLCLHSIYAFNKELETMLLNCPALENLTLEYCAFFDRLILTAPSVTLKSLTLVHLASDIPEIEIRIPSLLCFHLHSCLYPDRYSIGNFLSLEDAVLTLSYFLAYFGGDYDQTVVLPKIAHVKILTICNGTMENCSLKLPDDGDHPYENFPVVFPNLVELQMRLSIFDVRSLLPIHDLFVHCDFTVLEKLFIEVAALPDDHISDVEKTLSIEEMSIEDEPLYYVFDHLKTIKMTCFRGCYSEMQLVKFLLKRAIILEALVLVTSKNGIEQNFANELPTQTNSNEELLALVKEQLLLLPKASPNVRVVLYEHSKDCSGLRPTHTECPH